MAEGRAPTKADIKRAVREAVGLGALPTPAKARTIAKETGASVLDNTGRFQTGATKEQIERRELWFEVQEAVLALKDTAIDPAEFWRMTPGYELDELRAAAPAALRYLQALCAAIPEEEQARDP